MSKLRTKGISIRFRIFIFMMLMVVLSSILIAIVTVIQYNERGGEISSLKDTVQHKINNYIKKCRY